jgi:outer membrane protein TolC
MGKYGPYAVQPNPGNFNIPGPELQVLPDTVRLGEVGMTAADLGRAVQVLGDGAFAGDYRVGGQTIDLKVVTRDHGLAGALSSLEDAPIATPLGGIVPLGSLATLRRVNAAAQINREGRQRAVTLQFTAPPGLPLEKAIEEIRTLLDARRAAGSIPEDVDTTYTGSASKLEAVRSAMLGDGTLTGTLASSMFLALLIVYLLMCVLFQSWLGPLVILTSVPLATLGGFAGLRLVHDWSVQDRYMPVQNLDVLTMLGFVILIGVVVNNAILIVHQAGNFLRGTADEGGAPMDPRRAIAEAVRTRVRPILMTTLTSVLGMLPLVLMPGSGSELYRGLGSVVVGGLIVSTVFTLFLVPVLLSLVWRILGAFGMLPGPGGDDGAGTTSGDGSHGRAAPAAALVLIALVGAGCASDSGPESGDGLRRTLASIAARQIGKHDASGATTLPSPEVRLPADLQSRREALEALSGDASGGDMNALFGASPPPLRPLPLQEALQSALERRLGVRALRLDGEAALRQVEREEAAFDAVFFSEVAFDRRDQPAQVPVLGTVPLGSETSGRDSWLAESGLRRRAESGGVLEAAVRLERQRDRTPGISLDPDPSYWAGLTVQARQPLLRGYGATVNREDIERARLRASRSEEDLREEMLRVAEGTEAAFWDLAEAWRRLQVQSDLVRSGEEIEGRIRERSTFDAGGSERASALASLEFRRADLVRARRLVEASSDRLKAWMGSEDLPPLSPVLLLPDATFDEMPAVFDPLAAVRAALRERPAVRRAVLEIEDAALREVVAENGERPRLDAIAGVTLRGLDDDLAEAVGDPVDRDFYGWTVGLALEMPIGNRAARATLHEARLRRDASFLRYEETVRTVVEDVRAALRDMATARELLTSARTVRLAQAENLRALLAEEERRAALTPEFLALKLLQEDRLAAARLQEIAAQADFHRARAAWWSASGALPGAVVR